MCLDRPLQDGCFFPLMSYIGPHRIELNSGQMVVSQKQSLNLFNMSRCFAKPIHNSLFLYSFDMKMGLTHTYAAAISEVHVLTTSYPAFSSNLIIDRSFLFVARSLASSAPVS